MGTTTLRRFVRVDMRGLVVLVALVGVLVACGDEDESSVVGSSGIPATLTGSGDGVRADPDPSAPVAELAAGFNEAGFDLWRSLPVEENVVFSPSSIGHALLMAEAAADEQTRAAITDAFGLPQREGAHAAWNVLDQRLAEMTHEEVTVTVADRIWPRAGLQPEQRWLDLLAAQHGADVQTLDFAADPAGSRRAINDWVAEQTSGLIPDLLPEGFIDPGATELVLTDTLYFKARWRTVFGKYGPEAADFTRLDGSTVPVELLVEKEVGDRAGRGDGFVGAEVPYAGDAYSLLVLVPDEGRFAEVRGRLGQALLDDIDASFTSGAYELFLPPWHDDEQFDLLPWLTRIGAAPGSYPAISPDAFIGGAVHGADITVDEWGTTAAAATALDFAVSGPPEPELTVRADQPFLYLIRHRESGLVLFAGQVTDPTAG